MTENREVWVLGDDYPDADKSFTWDQTVHGISDADIVIVDLSTITQKMAKSSSRKFMEWGCKILDRVVHGGVIVFVIGRDIVSNSEKHGVFSIMSPIYIDYAIDEGTKLSYDEDHFFADYLNHVKRFDYYIRHASYQQPSAEQTIRPPHYGLECRDKIVDHSGRILGGTYAVRTQHQIILGKIVILPSATSISPRDAISKIIACFKEEIAEKAPSWINSINVYGLDEIKDKISKLEKKKQAIDEAISTQSTKKQHLSRYLELLYAQGTQLEKIVHDAFILLGFKEIRRGRSPGDEDWIIELNSTGDTKFGVLEVKGRNARTKQSDIVQCNKWVDDYLRTQTPIKTKGIFISNQFRLDIFTESRDKRRLFESNELGYAETRCICIIPTYVLFEAVNKILGGTNPDREKIEKLIFDTNGVLESIL